MGSAPSVSPRTSAYRKRKRRNTSRRSLKSFLPSEPLWTGISQDAKDERLHDDDPRPAPPIPELQSGDPVQRGFGERMAVNSPIQGSAADLIKVAMINVNRRLHQECRTTKMILQVHDELIFEVPEEDLEEAKQLVKTEMEATGKALGLSVPLKVDVGVGKNWRVAHP